MKIVKIQQSELMEGYEDDRDKIFRANIFASLIFLSWILVIYLIKIGYLKLLF